MKQTKAERAAYYRKWRARNKDYDSKWCAKNRPPTPAYLAKIEAQRLLQLIGIGLEMRSLIE